MTFIWGGEGESLDLWNPLDVIALEPGAQRFSLLGASAKLLIIVRWNTYTMQNVTKIWGKKRLCHHTLKVWNSLDRDTRNAPNIVNFKRSVLTRFFSYSFFSVVFVAFFPCFNCSFSGFHQFSKLFF